MSKNDGDFPAFPCIEKVITGYTADVPVSFHAGGTVDGRPMYEEVQHGGMTLRDYFAAKAMQSLIIWDADNNMCEGMISQRAYRQADAMLKEREK